MPEGPETTRVTWEKKKWDTLSCSVNLELKDSAPDSDYCVITTQSIDNIHTLSDQY